MGFVAGTLVHTQNGLVPIEQIKVGDWVLSKPESGEGETRYKRVVNTFTYEEKEVYSVDFAIDDKLYSVIATGNHPFWIRGLGWTAAREIHYPYELLLSDGRYCQVFNVSPLIRTATSNVGWIQGGFGVDDPDQELGRLIDLRGQKILIDYALDKQIVNKGFYPEIVNYFKVNIYHFEVEDDHTYFVGKCGSWVLADGVKD